MHQGVVDGIVTSSQARDIASMLSIQDPSSEWLDDSTTPPRVSGFVHFLRNPGPR